MPTCVSVIIPTYNRYDYLLDALESVRSQSVPTQIIVVNDGSTDSRYYGPELKDKLGSGLLIHSTPNSSEILREKFGNTDGRAAYTRNIGLKVATGDYIAFLDDDDIWLPGKLQAQIQAMEETKCEMSCTEAFTGVGRYSDQNKYELYIRECHRNFYTSIGVFEFPKIWKKEFLSKHNSCITSSVIISREVIGKIGTFPYKRVGEDYELWLRALDHTDCAFLDTPFLYYDFGHGSGILY